MVDTGRLEITKKNTMNFESMGRRVRYSNFRIVVACLRFRASPLPETGTCVRFSVPFDNATGAERRPLLNLPGRAPVQSGCTHMHRRRKPCT
ncbi:hypothetical protein EVAR_4922_1 [Eumeta japonica]|uniref:Uncharacterized protein n=1 Tax=Eumeta variegata TaxID=151549 RepID=A0A4C1Y0K1_EUMVA|nr:hypothetical protein EVAR_4922_1 [Eumeta japonica]